MTTTTESLVDQIARKTRHVDKMAEELELERQQRAALMAEAAEAGLPVTQIAAAAGMSRQAVHKLLERRT